MNLKLISEHKNGYIINRRYLCPCGRGEICEEDDYTPGFRDCFAALHCPYCNKKYRIDWGNSELSWDLVERLPARNNTGGDDIMPPTITNASLIKTKYAEMKRLFMSSTLNPQITDKFSEMNVLCQEEVNSFIRIPITSQATAADKNYIIFQHPVTHKYSRPVNIDIYMAGLETDISGQSKIDVFWDNVRNRRIADQSADDITSVLYTIAMNYCCCADLLSEVKSNSGDYFEKLIGHLFSMHLNLMPSTQLSAVELDGQSIPIPTDFIFDLGVGMPKFHVPVKTSTRERVVEVWAQQRVLDGAFGIGRFLCLLTCIGETNFKSSDMSVGLTCVPNQWMNYQLFIAQIKRAYYLDVPAKYDELNDRFPKIHVKKFGEFFHESNELVD